MRNQNKQVKASDYKLIHSNINVRVSLLSQMKRGGFMGGLLKESHQHTIKQLEYTQYNNIKTSNDHKET